MVRNFFKNGTNILFRKQSNILSAAVILMITYAASMVLGILRERILVSRFYFCCRESLDAYYAAFRLPDMIFQLVVIGALSAAFIPVFSEQLGRDEQKAYQISSSLINILLVFYLVLAIVIFIFAQNISKAITGQFSLFQIKLMANLTRIMLFAQAFFLISNFLTAILQSHQSFIIPAIAPLLYNLGIILAVWFFSPIWGIWAAAFGVVLGAFFHLLVQIPLAVRLGFSYKPIFNYRLPEVKEIFRLMIPRTIGLAVYQVEATVAIFLATCLPTGSLTIFHLAQGLMDLPVRLFGTSIGQASLPVLASQKVKGDLELFKETIISSLNQILYLSFPAMILILILRVPLVRIAFGAKTFPWQATILTGRTVALISFAIFSQSATQLLVRGFYARHDTKTPLIVGVFAVGFNIVIGVASVFKFSWGIIGLAAATSASSFIQASLLFIFLERRINGLFSKKIIIKWTKMVTATFFTGLVCWLAMRFLDLFVLDTSKTINLLALTLFTGTAGITFYFALTKFLGIEEFEKFLAIASRFGKLKAALFPPQEIIDTSQKTIS